MLRVWIVRSIQRRSPAATSFRPGNDLIPRPGHHSTIGGTLNVVAVWRPIFLSSPRSQSNRGDESLQYYRAPRHG
jgi:hypothetical protein